MAKNRAPELRKGRKYKSHDGRAIKLVEEHLHARPGDPPEEPPGKLTKEQKEDHKQALELHARLHAEAVASDIFICDFEGQRPGWPMTRAALEAALEG